MIMHGIFYPLTLYLVAVTYCSHFITNQISSISSNVSDKGGKDNKNTNTILCIMRNSNALSWRRSGPSSLVVVFVVVTQLLLMTAAVVATAKSSSSNNDVPYRLLAKVVQEKMSQNSDSEDLQDQEIPSIQKLAKTLSKLASSQQTFKVSLLLLLSLLFMSLMSLMLLPRKNRSQLICFVNEMKLKF